MGKWEVGCGEWCGEVGDKVRISVKMGRGGGGGGEAVEGKEEC